MPPEWPHRASDHTSPTSLKRPVQRRINLVADGLFQDRHRRRLRSALGPRGDALQSLRELQRSYDSLSRRVSTVNNQGHLRLQGPTELRAAPRRGPVPRPAIPGGAVRQADGVIVGIEEWQNVIETLAELDDPAYIQSTKQARREIELGETLTLEELRRELARAQDGA